MRVASQLIRWTIPGALILIVWFVWLVVNDVENTHPSIRDARGFWEMKVGTQPDGSIVALAGFALIVGWIIAQMYWAIYWLIQPGTNVPWLAINYTDVLEKSGVISDQSQAVSDQSQKKPDESQIEAIVRVDLELFINRPLAENQKGWEFVREVLSAIFDAYHALGTAIISVISGCITILGCGLYMVFIGAHGASFFTYLIFYSIISCPCFCLFVARNHAGRRGKLYLIECIKSRRESSGTSS